MFDCTQLRCNISCWSPAQLVTGNSPAPDAGAKRADGGALTRWLNLFKLTPVAIGLFHGFNHSSVVYFRLRSFMQEHNKKEKRKKKKKASRIGIQLIESISNQPSTRYHLLTLHHSNSKREGINQLVWLEPPWLIANQLVNHQSEQMVNRTQTKQPTEQLDGIKAGNTGHVTM